MSAQSVNYQCPACGGPLHFVGSTGRLQCDYCDSTYAVAEIEALYAAKEESAAGAFQAAQQTAAPEEAPPVISQAEKEQWASSHWDASTISDDWGEAGAGMRAYECPSCGGELLCEATTAATQCPYCGNPTIVPGQFNGALKPEWVIPFRLERDAALTALKGHYKKKIFLPKDFTDANQVKKLQGVYVPFWLFDGAAAAECRYEGTNSSTHRQGDYRVTKTHHFDVRRSGTVKFQGVPADASRKMPDALMDSLEPFPYTELRPFSTAYLPGFVADKYDVSVEECAQRADSRCTASAEAIMRADVSGYQSVTTKRSDVYISRDKVHYVLLPVWILTTRWKDKSYIFAMNGQTGKLVGDLPVDKGRFFAFFGGLSAVLSALLFLTGFGGLLARLFLGLL